MDAAPRAPRLILPVERPPSEVARRVSLGARAGLFAAAATVGTLVGFGLRDGSMLRPFASLGRRALALEAAHMGLARAAATGAGIVLHVTAVLCWAILFTLVAARWRGWRRWVAAAVIGALAYVADGGLVPEVLRVVDAPGVLPLQRGAVYVVLSLSLAIGMGVALSASRPD